MISAFGAANALFGSDKPRLRAIEVIKNQQLQDIIDPQIGRTGESFGLLESDVNRFRRMFEEQEPEFERIGREELGQFEDIYSGRLEQQLRDLRGREAVARKAATEGAMRRLRGQDQTRRSRLGVPGGGGSFLDVLQARLMRDTETESALAGTAQERADFGALSQMQLAGIGQRGNILDRIAQRPLGRAGVEAGATAPLLNQLAALQAMDEANKHRGLYRKRGTLERLSDFENIVNTDIQNIASTAGSVAGIAGGLCWVAREVYGEDDQRWRMFRYWLLMHAPVALVKFYVLFGPRLAMMVRQHPGLKARVRSWMDAVLK